MNYRDVEAVNGALDSMTQNLLRRKMLEEQTRERQAQTGLASQRLATDQAFRQAQLEHYKQIEQNQQDNAQKAQDQAALQDKQRMLQAVMGLNAGGQLNEDSISDVNDWLANDEHFSRTGIQIQKVKKPNPLAGQTALGQAFQMQDAYQQEYDDPNTPYERKADLRQRLDLLDDVIKRQTTPAAATAEEPEIEVNEGSGVPGAASTKYKFKNRAQYQQYLNSKVQPAPADPKARVGGTSYKVPNGSVMIWSGTGWTPAAAAAPQVQQ